MTAVDSFLRSAEVMYRPVEILATATPHIERHERIDTHILHKRISQQQNDGKIAFLPFSYRGPLLVST